MKQIILAKEEYMVITEKTKRTVALIYLAVTSLMLFASGICLIGAACGINALGDSPFNYKTVSDAFSRIAPVIYITAALIIIGGAVSFFVKGSEKKQKGARTLSKLVCRESECRALADGSPEEKKIGKERRLREILLAVTVLLFILGAVISLVYALDSKNYSDALNSSVLKMFVLAIISLIPAAVLFTVTGYVSDASYRRELEIWRTLPKKEKSSGACNKKTGIKMIFDPVFWEDRRTVLAIRLSVLTLSAVFIVLGVYNGGMRDVLEKAIKICTECIGLG